jgi:hypothetical protein
VGIFIVDETNDRGSIYENARGLFNQMVESIFIWPSFS